MSRPAYWLLLVSFACLTALAGCADNAGGGGNNNDNDASDTSQTGDTTTGDTTIIGGDTTTTNPTDVVGDTGGTDTMMPPLPDADGDGIADEHEGDADTDGDGTPDRMDADSDNDGIPDSVEAGDSNTNTPPIDSDGDGTPDFRDTDSDDNGILDAVELDGDRDMDGVPDYRDDDNDNDAATDLAEIVGAGGDCNGDGQPDPAGDAGLPWDCDANGTPDYNDTDSDGDTIPDIVEGATRDADMDGFLDRYDLDSDGDGIPDSVEAGDADPTTPPVDTDGDLSPDFRDLDSDNDGLPDALEVANGTNPLSTDSDNDGVDDLVEVAAGTNPNDAADNPTANGDFFFRVPYQENTTPDVDTLEFRTNIQFADLYFGFDVTGSMGEELSAMRNTTTGVPDIINTLRCAPTTGACMGDDQCTGTDVCFNGQCIQDPNAGAGCIPDLWTGVAAWWELNQFENKQSLGPDPVTTANRVPCPASSSDLYNGSTCGSGPGGAEAPQQMPYCVADGSVCGRDCASTGIGCGGFRTDAIRIYIQITDADDQCSGTGCSNYSPNGAGMALAAQGIKFIGLWGTGDDVGTDTPEGIANKIGVGSGTLDMNNMPFVYQALDADVKNKTIDAVRAIARGVPLDVTIQVTDQPDDDGDALQFIDYLEVNVSGSGNCTPVSMTDDRHFADGRPDSFPSLLPGTGVCWDVRPVVMNTTQMATTEPQIFVARVTVVGDGSPLDSRDVYFLVPPVIANIPN